jgi:long-chain acyl-CoA synthetase
MNSGISIFYAESMETIGNDLKEVKPVLFTTVPRLLEKVFEKIMVKGAELTGIKKKLFDWAVKLGLKYDISSPGGWSYQCQLWLANKIIFNKWRAALGGNVKYVITGGAACQVKLLRIFTAAGVPVFEGYGPTENSPVISVNCQKKGGTKFGTVGLVIEGQEVKLEEDGEICVKGPSVMMGYYKRPDLTQEVIIDGWLHTGDIGVMEDGGYLKITDRKKELFKTSGGKYVAPQVIENKIKECQFVEQIMVIGAEQKFVGALIVPSFQALNIWLEEKNIKCSTNLDAIKHPEVVAHFQNLVEQYNQHFNPFEQIKKFVLIAEEWCVENGELTPKLSMKRKVITEKHQTLIEHLYQ